MCSPSPRSRFSSAHVSSAELAAGRVLGRPLLPPGNGPFLCSSGRDHQASFLPRAKVSPAPRCPLSGPTSWPSSRTSPIGPRCTSASASCWARTGSTGEPSLPPTSAARGPAGTRHEARHLTQHLPSSFLRALQPFLPSPGCTTAPGRGPFSGHCFLGTEHAGPVSLLQVTIRAGSQAQSSPRSPGHAHGCLHTVPRGHQMTLCGWQVWGWAGPAWGRERSGRTGRPCPLTADLGPSSGAPGSVRGLTRPPREPVSPPSAPTPCFPF